MLSNNMVRWIGHYRVGSIMRWPEYVYAGYSYVRLLPMVMIVSIVLTTVIDSGYSLNSSTVLTVFLVHSSCCLFILVNVAVGKGAQNRKLLCYNSSNCLVVRTP